MALNSERYEALFQSTPPHGGATAHQVNTGLPGCFNPRPRTGGRLKQRLTSSGTGQFQSTPPHGGATSFSQLPRTALRFQSTPPHGGRH